MKPTSLIPRLAAFAILATLCLDSLAQQSIPQSKSSPLPNCTVSPLVIQQARPSLTEDEYRAELIAHLPKEKAPSSSPAWIGAAVGVIAAVLSFLGALVAGMRQMSGLREQIKAVQDTARFAAQKEEDKVRVQTALDFTSKTLDLRLRQLEYFYAPLLAYCRQMKGLRDKLETYLIQTNASEYRQGPDGRLQVATGPDTWVDFRMLDRLPHLKRDTTAAELSRKILETGERMVTVIQEKSGLAGVGCEISTAYGEYLAHFAILKMIFDDKSRSDPYPPGWHKCGYYPRHLDTEIEKGYRETWSAVQEYKALSDNTFASLKEKAPK